MKKGKLFSLTCCERIKSSGTKKVRSPQIFVKKLASNDSPRKNNFFDKQVAEEEEVLW